MKRFEFKPAAMAYAWLFLACVVVFANAQDKPAEPVRSEVKTVSGLPAFRVNDKPFLYIGWRLHSADDDMGRFDNSIEEIKQAASLGVTVIEIPVPWYEVEFQRECFNWTKMDALVACADELKLKVVFSLGPDASVPKWFYEMNPDARMADSGGKVRALRSWGGRSFEDIKAEAARRGVELKDNLEELWQSGCTNLGAYRVYCREHPESLPREGFNPDVDEPDGKLKRLSGFRARSSCAAVPNHEGLLDECTRFVKMLVVRYRKHPALFGWSASCGLDGFGAFPSRSGEDGGSGWYDCSEWSRKSFAKWLVEVRYKGDDKRLKSAWGAQLEDGAISLEEMPKVPTEIPKADERPLWMDWMAFRDWQKDVQFNRVAAAVKGEDPNHVLIMPATVPHQAIWRDVIPLLMQTGELGSESSFLNADADAIVLRTGLEENIFRTNRYAPEIGLARAAYSHGKAVIFKLTNRMRDPAARLNPDVFTSMMYFSACGGFYPLFYGGDNEPFAVGMRREDEGPVRENIARLKALPRVTDCRRAKFAVLDVSSDFAIEAGLSGAQFHEASLTMAGLAVVSTDFEIVTPRQMIEEPKALSVFKFILVPPAAWMDPSLKDALKGYAGRGGRLVACGESSRLLPFAAGRMGGIGADVVNPASFVGFLIEMKGNMDKMGVGYHKFLLPNKTERYALACGVGTMGMLVLPLSGEPDATTCELNLPEWSSIKGLRVGTDVDAPVIKVKAKASKVVFEFARGQFADQRSVFLQPSDK
jgi:hypothetical protein